MTATSSIKTLLPLFFLLLVSQRSNAQNKMDYFKSLAKSNNGASISFNEDSSIITVKQVKNDGAMILLSAYYTKTKKLERKGQFIDGWNAGIWNYYDQTGKLYKEINFTTGEKKLHGIPSEPYDSVFAKIRKKADALLLSTYGETFVKTYLRFNAAKSGFNLKNQLEQWFVVPNAQPKAFLLFYNLVLDDSSRFGCIHLSMDSLGNFLATHKLYPFQNQKETPLIRLKQADSVALANGVEPTQMYRGHSFVTVLDSSTAITTATLVLRINGDFFENIEKKDHIEKNYYVLDIDPWTGAILNKSIATKNTTQYRKKNR